MELNDIPLFVVQHHPSSEMLHRTRYPLQTLDAEGAESARVMPVSVHPYITGVPHRIAFFDQMLVHLQQHPGVLCLRPGEILDWYLQETGTAGDESAASVQAPDGDR